MAFKRKDQRISYTVLLVGAASTGKRTFLNNLLDTHYFKDTQSPLPKNIHLTAPLHDVVGVSLNLSKCSVEINDVSDPLLLNIVLCTDIDTNIDNTPVLTALDEYLSEQFDSVLSEETKVRRNTRVKDTRVHVCLYFIEDLFGGLRQLDIQVMKVISEYTNVLPVISKADAYTKQTLSQYKQQILHDIDQYNIPIYKFDTDSSTDSSSVESTEENSLLSSLQPFAIITSDNKDVNGYYRKYPYGTLRLTETISDLTTLQKVLFGTHLQQFKDTMLTVLYENYRAEKLASVTGKPSTAPSLSNFTQLVNTGQFSSQQQLQDVVEDHTPTNSITELPPVTMSPASNTGNPGTMNSPERQQLRNISNTVPFVLRHKRNLQRQLQLEELEAESARQLQLKVEELEKRAKKLKEKETLLRTKRNTTIKETDHDSQQGRKV